MTTHAHNVYECVQLHKKSKPMNRLRAFSSVLFILGKTMYAVIVGGDSIDLGLNVLGDF